VNCAATKSPWHRKCLAEEEERWYRAALQKKNKCIMECLAEEEERCCRAASSTGGEMCTNM
jgi:hypothetical protein